MPSSAKAKQPSEISSVELTPVQPTLEELIERKWGERHERVVGLLVKCQTRADREAAEALADRWPDMRLVVTHKHEELPAKVKQREPTIHFLEYVRE